MKSVIKVVGLVGISASLLCACSKGKESVELKTLEDSASYCLGFIQGAQMAQQGVDSLNMDAYLDGFNAFDPDEQKFPLDLEQEAYVDMMNRFIEKLEQKNLEKLKTEFAPNIEAEQAFLKENGEKEGVVTTATGLQYKITKEGNGPKPSLYDTVEVLYKGTLLDGSVFDETIGTETRKFVLGQVIPAWNEGLALMNEGSKATLYAPSELAYGAYGAGEQIKPYTMLVFDVELVKVIKGKAPEYPDMTQFK